MRRVKADDADAFEELYDRYSSRAFGLATVICNSSERAEEAVQDAFLSVWRSRARYDEGRGGIQNWIFALVRNRSIDIYRRNRRGDGLRASEANLDRIAMIGSAGTTRSSATRANVSEARCPRCPRCSVK